MARGDSEANVFAVPKRQKPANTESITKITEGKRVNNKFKQRENKDKDKKLLY